MKPRLLTKLTPEMQQEVEQIREGAKESIDEIEQGGVVAKPMEPVAFTQSDHRHYKAEYAARGQDFVFHFFPLEEQNFPDRFYETMSDAFFEVFKLPDRLEAAPSQELNSWAVRARGFNHPLGTELPTRLFEVLDQKLG